MRFSSLLLLIPLSAATLSAQEKGGLSDLTFRAYEGNWNSLPDFSKLEPARSGKLENNKMDIAAAKRSDHFAIVFDGKFNAPEAGTYTFYISSDDGSRILINGETVADYDGLHGAVTTKAGKVELAAGAHDLQLQYFEKDGSEQLFADWSPDGKAKHSMVSHSQITPMGQELLVEDKPLVFRALMQGDPTRMVAVGLPGGLNYAFDTEACEVRYIWRGDFLDIRAERENRGGRPTAILGARAEVGATGHAAILASATEVPTARYVGYMRPGAEPPVFHYTVDGVLVKQTVTSGPGGNAVQYLFEVPEAESPIYFRINRDQLDVSASAGEWTDDTLRLSPEEAKRFTVTIRQ